MPSSTGIARVRHVARAGLLAVATTAAALMFFGGQAAGQGEFFVLPRATLDPATTSTRETIVLAGGCFWGIQALYQRIEGVESAVSGYSGGAANTAEYYTVGTGTTGHAEAVEVVYNPQIISYGEILRIFFSVAHDPTQLNYQGPDRGTQYRSHIYYTTEEQRQVTEAYIDQLDAARIYPAEIVTRVDPLEAFYPAEGYHQDYLINNPTSAYIVYWDLPKLENTYQLFREYWRDAPVTVASTRPDLIR